MGTTFGFLDLNPEKSPNTLDFAITSSLMIKFNLYFGFFLSRMALRGTQSNFWYCYNIDFSRPDEPRFGHILVQSWCRLFCAINSLTPTTPAGHCTTTQRQHITAGSAMINKTVSTTIVTTSTTVKESVGLLCKICGENQADKLFRGLFKWPNACFARWGTTKRERGLSRESRRREPVCSTCVNFKNNWINKGREERTSLSEAVSGAVAGSSTATTPLVTGSEYTERIDVQLTIDTQEQLVYYYYQFRLVFPKNGASDTQTIYTTVLYLHLSPPPSPILSPTWSYFHPIWIIVHK